MSNNKVYQLTIEAIPHLKGPQKLTQWMDENEIHSHLAIQNIVVVEQYHKAYLTISAHNESHLLDIIDLLPFMEYFDYNYEIVQNVYSVILFKEEPLNFLD